MAPLSVLPYTHRQAEYDALTSRQAWEAVTKPYCKAVERPLVQILVVAANIQMRTFEDQGGERFHVNSIAGHG